jgi:hypothetical protein
MREHGPASPTRISRTRPARKPDQQRAWYHNRDSRAEATRRTTGEKVERMGSASEGPSRAAPIFIPNRTAR